VGSQERQRGVAAHYNDGIPGPLGIDQEFDIHPSCRRCSGSQEQAISRSKGCHGARQWVGEDTFAYEGDLQTGFPALGHRYLPNELCLNMGVFFRETKELLDRTTKHLR
jgi:hypothetical protein